MLYGIESSVGATSSRPLDRLLFFLLWSDHTIGPSEAGDVTVFTYATDFCAREGPADRGAGAGRGAAAGVTGWLDCGCFGVADLNAFLAREAPSMSSSSDPASCSPSITGFAVHFIIDEFLIDHLSQILNVFQRFRAEIALP